MSTPGDNCEGCPCCSIGLKYRRIHPGWHGSKADAAVYRQGTELPVVDTPLGRTAFLICGDLFDDTVLRRFRDPKADWMLLPFSRSFSDGSTDQVRWDREEMPWYSDRIRMAGTPALMVNFLADSSLQNDKSFGGAYVISAEGELKASLPLGKEGILIAEV